MKSGQYEVVEDFVPVSDTEALITAGPGLRDLSAIALVEWSIEGECIVLSRPIVLRSGEYLRLGNLTKGGGLIYSEGWEGPHQPHLAGGRYYCTNDAPCGQIYRDGKLFIDYWDDTVEVTNPWVDEVGGHIYFEARDGSSMAPTDWNVWRCDMDGENKELVVHGANPCVFDGSLYFGVWNGHCFDIGIMDAI